MINPTVVIRPTKNGSPSPGDIVGRYIIGRQLGTGHTTEVFAAHCQQTHQTYAVKVRRGDVAPDVARERLAREASILDHVDHPHLLRVRERILFGDREGLVVDLAVHGTLDDHLEESGPLTLGELDALGTGLLLAASAAHRAGVRHGHIRTHKVLVGGPATAPSTRLTGWGRAQDAPWHPVESASTDLYDLGAVLFTLAMSGHTPDPRSARLTALEQHPWLPARIRDAIAASLAPAWRRTGSARRLLSMWQGSIIP